MTLEDLQRYNVRTVVIPMPGKTNGDSIKLLDGYLIRINENRCGAVRYEALLHEWIHIIRGDHDRDDPVEEIEGK